MRKLFYGHPKYNVVTRYTAYQNLFINLKNIWNNEKHNDIGLEKILRLFLVASQLIFPGLHIRHFFGKKGVITRDLAIELYVLLKTALPLIILLTGWYKSSFAIGISIYLLFETMCYVASLIFVSDIFVKPRSYRRNILMLSLNYIEIAFCFAVVYAGLHLLNDQAQTVVDYIYFSIITSTTVGYGDIYPVSGLGKMIACTHAFMTVSFIVLFMNFFTSKVEIMHKSDDL